VIKKLAFEDALLAASRSVDVIQCDKMSASELAAAVTTIKQINIA